MIGPHSPSRWYRAGAAAAIVAAALLVSGCQPSIPQLTPKEQAFMNDYTAHMVTRCFGRYLIDLPADMQPGKMAAATFAIQPYSEYSGALRVKVTPLPHTVFKTQLAQREAKLKSEHVVAHPGWEALGQSVPLPGGEGMILNWTNGETRSTRRLELHGWKGGYAIKMTIDALDESFPEDKDDPPELKAGADVPQKLAMLQSLYALTRGRVPDEIPKQPGTCIQNGFISGVASDKMREDIVMDFVSKQMPDVNVNLTTDSATFGAGDTLLDRMPAIEANVKAAKGEILRKGRGTSQSGVNYEAVLVTGITQHDHVMGQYFTLEANSGGGTLGPLTHVDFFNGDREYPANPPEDDLWRIPVPQTLPPLAKASLTEAESVALWDKVVATLRKRPGAF